MSFEKVTGLFGGSCFKSVQGEIDILVVFLSIPSQGDFM